MIQRLICFIYYSYKNCWKVYLISELKLLGFREKYLKDVKWRGKEKESKIWWKWICTKFQEFKQWPHKNLKPYKKKSTLPLSGTTKGWSILPLSGTLKRQEKLVIKPNLSAICCG